MRLLLATFLLAVLAGYVAGGRLGTLGKVKVRWAPAAVVGLAMQLAPVPGHVLPLALLYGSFVLLLAFAAVNIRVAGFALIAAGIVLNLTVIAANRGMPVTRQALVASGQVDTLDALVGGGGAKHHLATPSDRLLFLGDAIAIRAVRQAVSVGDVCTYLGVCWLIFAGMRRRDGARARPGSNKGGPVVLDVHR